MSLRRRRHDEPMPTSSERASFFTSEAMARATTRNVTLWDTPRQRNAAARSRAGAGGRSRTGTDLSALRIFVPLRLSPPPSGVRGLDYPFTLAMCCRCCPSSLYTFPLGKGLGSGLPVKVSPNLSSSAPRVSLGALNRSSPLRLPVSPRPHTGLFLARDLLAAKPNSVSARSPP
jgi:hypothetical protein